jgi:L-ascorbate metabolism protein UlaG (beta-lactamase superfamily)
MDILDQTQWLGQSTVKIETSGYLIYIDPYMLTGKDKADFIFITHGHYDHLSPEDIRKIATSNTIIYAPYNCIPKLADAGFKKVKGIQPGDKEDTDAFRFEAVPAYNVIKTTFHPRKQKWLGYILEIDEQKIYHAGDTERIPEMKKIQCDLALLPLGQTYTMNSVEEAVQAAIDVKAKTAIPIHYGLYEGTSQDALKFRDLLKNKVEVVIRQL